MKIHKLKLRTAYYKDSESGKKDFEVRKNDRDFHKGDILELREYVTNVGGGIYTGNMHRKQIIYILDDDTYLKQGYVVLGCVPVGEPGVISRKGL